MSSYESQDDIQVL